MLHTWTQGLRRHLHVHALMACGALRRDGQGAPTWVTPVRGERFLFPVHALSKVFRGKFLAALGVSRLDGDPANTEARRAGRDRALRRHDWVVYAKTPLAGPAAVPNMLPP